MSPLISNYKDNNNARQECNKSFTDQINSYQPYKSDLNKERKTAAVAIVLRIKNSYPEILILERVRNNNTLQIPGGTIESGEGIFECSLRELLEETGMPEEELLPYSYWIDSYSVKRTKFSVVLASAIIFFTITDNETFTVPDNEEGISANPRWINLNDFLNSVDNEDLNYYYANISMFKNPYFREKLSRSIIKLRGYLAKEVKRNPNKMSVRILDNLNKILAVES